MEKKKRVLFYCKHNSCRSQIAEAYLRHFTDGKYDIYSAGLNPEPIHPMVKSVLLEDGISLEGQSPKGIDLYLGKEPFNNIIIVCQEGEAECPKLYPFAMKTERWALSDPAEVTGDKNEILAAFRHTRDQIKNKIQIWLGQKD